MLGRVGAKHAVFVLIGAVVIALEIYLVFIKRHGDFRIEGKEAFDLAEFASGAVVAHAFLMRGDGLNSVAVQFGSDSKARLTVQWTLWRGKADQPGAARAFEGTEVLNLRPGHQWRTFEFIRDASSRDRWYTFEVHALAVERLAPASEDPARTPRVALVASRDNPERGGLLLVDGALRPGSLFIRAGRQGRTIYRRFVVEAELYLPAPLRIRSVQWALVIAFHWAFLVFAWAVLGDAERRLGPARP